MNSGGIRGFTVVTILTLVLAPILSHGHSIWSLGSVTTESHTEACVVHQPCPANRIVVNVVKANPPAR